MKTHPYLRVLFFFSFFILQSIIAQQDGTLDASFGDSGIVRTQLLKSNDVCNDAVKTSDNKIIAIGSTYNGTDKDIVLVCYNQDGTLDESFGNGGIVTTDIDDANDVATHIVIDQLGYIMVTATSVKDNVTEHYLLAYDKEGNHPSFFQGQGKVTTPIEAKGITIAADNDIVIAGTTTRNDSSNFTLVRFYSDGILNTDWADEGFSKKGLGYKREIVEDITVDSKGKFVVAGKVYPSGLDMYAVARYNSDGSFDINFGENGKVVGSVNSKQKNYGKSIVVDKNDKIYLAGYYGINSESLRAYLLRLENNGILDNTFGEDGISTFAWDYYSPNRSIDVQINNNNKIILSGLDGVRDKFYRSAYEIKTVRLNPNGTTDTYLTIPLSIKSNYKNTLVITEQNKVVLAGTLGKRGSEFRLNKFDEDGNLDPTFGNSGQVTTPLNQYGIYNNSATKIIISADNKILVGSKFNYLRYNTNGSLDYTFDTDASISKIVGGRGSFLLDEGSIISTSVEYVGNDKLTRTITKFKPNGLLDKNFGNEGRGYTLQPLYTHYKITSSDIIKDVNGKYIITGKLDPGLGRDSLYLTRYNLDGTYDSEFGKLKPGILVNNSFIKKDSEGKLIVTGYLRTSLSSDSKFCLALVKLNSDGTLDNSFGTNGIAESKYEDNRVNNNAMVLDKQDRIIVLRTVGSEYSIVRFNKNGTVDESFGENGYANVPIYAYNMTIDNSGNFIVVGAYSNGNNKDIAVLRFLSNGTLDETFGSNGIAVFPIGDSEDEGLSVSIDNDGQIIVGGQTYYNDDNYDIVLLKIHNSAKEPIDLADGTLDGTFGNGGFVKTSLGDKDYSFDSVIDPEGKLVSVGTTVTNSNPDFGIVRYNQDGSLDNSFGNQGKVITPFGYADDHARSVIIDKNGKIVVAGFTQVAGDVADQFDFAVARYNTNGTLDASFGNGGKVITSLGPDYDFGSSVVLDNSDKLIIVGLTEQAGQFDLGLTRLNSDGTVDTSFGNNGKTITKLGLPLKLTNNPNTGTNKMAVMPVDFPWIEILPDVVIDNKGRIVVAATALFGNKLKCFLSRYNSDGTIDMSFGNNGTVITSISPEANRRASYSAKVLIDIQGKILLLANAENDCSFGFSLLRFNENGSLDENYGESGKADFGWTCSFNSAKDAVIDSLGRVIVAVNGNNKNESVLMLYRVMKNGYTDDSFDEDGIVETLLDDTILFPESINLTSKGQIVVTGIAGEFNNGVNAKYLAIRYNGSTPPLVRKDDTTIVVPPADGDDGDLDLSYGNNGFAFISVNKKDICTNATIDSEGRIILIGHTIGGTKGVKHIPIVVRNTTDGTIDNSFGQNGIVTLSDLDNITAVDIDSKGRIIVVGTNANKTDTYTTDSYDFAVARLLSNGSLDNNFGESGIVLTDLKYNDYATDVIIGTNNKITVVGYSTNDDWKKIILARYKVDGNLDENFGVNGITTVIDNAEIIESDLVMDGFERLLVRTNENSLYRFKKDGSTDISFGNNGIVEIQTPYENPHIVNTSIDLEDRILVLGNGGDGKNTGTFLIRYNVDGSIDNNFGNEGFSDVACGQMLYEGVDLIVNEKGGILVAAIYDDGLEQHWTKRGDISILAYTEDGWTDDSFNDDGIVETSNSGSREEVKFIGIDPIGNIFIAGTKITNRNSSIHHDFFVAKYFGSTKAGESGANVGSKDYTINQNYPNPFNPSTVIRFKIPSDNNVTLRIFNMLGQEVCTLVNEYKSAGLYKVTFDATGLPSGIYVYRLDAGSFTEVHKMLLLK